MATDYFISKVLSNARAATSLITNYTTRNIYQAADREGVSFYNDNGSLANVADQGAFARNISSSLAAGNATTITRTNVPKNFGTAETIIPLNVFGSIDFGSTRLVQPDFSSDQPVNYAKSNFDALYRPGSSGLSTNTETVQGPLDFFGYSLIKEGQRLDDRSSSFGGSRWVGKVRGIETSDSYFRVNSGTLNGNGFGSPFGRATEFNVSTSADESLAEFPIVGGKNWNGFGALPANWNKYTNAAGEVKNLPWGTRREAGGAVYSGSSGGGWRTQNTVYGAIDNDTWSGYGTMPDAGSRIVTYTAKFKNIDALSPNSVSGSGSWGEPQTPWIKVPQGKTNLNSGWISVR